MEKLSYPLLHIQPKFNLDSWNGSIRYDKIIEKDLVHKIRNALKINKINTFSMNMREEYYYIEQIVFYLYKRILTYFDENDLKNFELIELEYFCNIPKTPWDLINNIEVEVLKIVKFILKYAKISINNEKIRNVIETTNFKSLRKMEDMGQFKEYRNKDFKFFNKGPDNKWEDNLNKNIREEIENKYKISMKKLGYL